MANDSIFGNIVPGVLLENAVMEIIHSWMPTYLQELERQLGWERGRIPSPRYYTTRNEFDSFPEDKMPMCVVVSPGLADPPTREGDGTYSADWAIGVGFAAQAKDADSSHAMATIYAAAGRALLLQHTSLGGVAHGIEWIDESYDDLVTEENRTIRAAYNIYRVSIWDVVKKGAGPVAPTTPPDPENLPGSNWPTAETIEIAVGSGL